MNVVITGASRGMGFAVAKIFLERSHANLLALSDDAKGLAQLIEPESGASRLRTLAMDLGQFDHQVLVDSVAGMECIDILINNAGIVFSQDFQEISMDQWQQIFAVNLFGAVQMIGALLPKLQSASGAHIVNIGSMGGFQGSVKFPGLSAYSASKAALANLTESLAVEFKSDRISVNCLCPGAVNTAMFREAFDGFTAPLQTDEMAEYIHHFACHGQKYFNGKVLPVSQTTP